MVHKFKFALYCCSNQQSHQPNCATARLTGTIISYCVLTSWTTTCATGAAHFATVGDQIDKWLICAAKRHHPRQINAGQPQTSMNDCGTDPVNAFTVATSQNECATNDPVVTSGTQAVPETFESNVLLQMIPAATSWVEVVRGQRRSSKKSKTVNRGSVLTRSLCLLNPK
jgi:hypothetical protein